MANFIPGPWSDNGDGFICQAEQNEGHRLFVAQVIEIPFDFGGDKVTEANLALIAAAPEMYRDLKSAVACLRAVQKELSATRGTEMPTLNEILAVWEATLAKAEGKQAVNG